MASQGSSQGSRAASRTDPGWKYCHSLDENDTNTIVCNFCGKITRGGITRAKQHLMGKKGNVSACTKCPKEVREELWDLLRGKKKQESAEIASARNIDLENLGYGDSESEGEINEGFGEVVAKASHASGSKKLKCPIDLFCRKPETAIEKRKKERLRQTSIRETCDKETTARVHQYIARFWYQAGLSFNCIKLKSFHDMLQPFQALGQICELQAIMRYEFHFSRRRWSTPKAC
ncbi:hypothetical protein Cni_G16167 [Canna indica]|uniref:BED-type domain-containing protein n=1 Tax=Canna indica TaxID=4628 RepID=A0AAQ3QFE9_9LILI|nr:hypothetical protein Cni_G16167 [Canna indica]